jgi:hypothetical protein
MLAKILSPVLAALSALAKVALCLTITSIVFLTSASVIDVE